MRYFTGLFGDSTLFYYFCRRMCDVVCEIGIPYLKAIFKGKKPVSERLLKLDAERFKKGDLPLSNLLSKYCSYIAQSN